MLMVRYDLDVKYVMCPLLVLCSSLDEFVVAMCNVWLMCCNGSYLFPLTLIHVYHPKKPVTVAIRKSGFIGQIKLYRFDKTPNIKLNSVKKNLIR